VVDVTATGKGCGPALLAATALAIANGDVGSLGGWMVVAAASLTLAGLVLVVRRGLQAGAAIERALTDGLDGGWRAQIEPGMAVRLRRRLPLARRDVSRSPDRHQEGDRLGARAR